MSAAEQFTADGEATGALVEQPAALAAAPEVIEVRRNGGVAALIGAASSALAIAWFARAVSSGSLFDWALVVVTGLLGVGWLASFLDARTPLLVADAQGARIRLGRSWIGLPWSAVESVRHSERTSWLRDGRIEVVAHNPERLMAGLAPAAARQAAAARRLHGGPLALPLGLGTTLVGSDHQRLGTDIAAMAFIEPDVVVRPPARVEDVDTAEEPAGRGGLAERFAPVSARLSDARSRWAEQSRARSEAKAHREVEKAQVAEAKARELEESRTAQREADEREHALEEARREDDLGLEAAVSVVEEPAVHAEVPSAVASPTPAPLREVPRAARSEVLRAVEGTGVHKDADSAELTVAPQPVSADAKVTPIAAEGPRVAPLVIDDYEVEPANDPVIGPDLRAARTRLAFSVDQLAERTRIRPHVIEAIEVDDFVPCGGDFYARGHLKTLARVLGVAPEPLLERYDERYAHAPLEARKVFEAELATGQHGSIRGTRGGSNWSVLVAAVMGIVLLWSVVQLVMDQPGGTPDAPVLNGSGGPSGSAVAGDPVKVEVAAPEGGAEVVVRDANGEIVWSGALAVGEKTSVKALAPVRVQSSDGAVTVSVDGRDRGAVGPAGAAAQGTYAGK